MNGIGVGMVDANLGEKNDLEEYGEKKKKDERLNKIGKENGGASEKKCGKVTGDHDGNDGSESEKETGHFGD